jgi:hypothetical protein
MSTNDDVRRALKPLIEKGIIHEAHIIPHASYGPGTVLPEQVNVSALVNAVDPEEHREEVLRLLKEAGIAMGQANLHRNPMWVEG